MAKNHKKTAQQRFDDNFISEVIEAVKKNEAPWQKSWSTGKVQSPYNAQSNSFYSGRNAVRLALEAQKRGFHDPRWATYKQITEMGGSVNKGEKGTGILWYGEKTITDKETDEKQTIPIARHYHVFNIQQTNLPVLTLEELREHTPDPQVFSDLIEAHAPNLAQGNPSYRPANDTIYMPAKEAFKTDADYYATMLHEMSHWTGHESRLNRNLKNKFGSPEYAQEELVAELSSYMLSLEHGLPFTPNQHEAYLQHWAKQTDTDMENALLQGFKDATTAKNFINTPLRERLQQETTKAELPDKNKATETFYHCFYDEINEQKYYNELRASKLTYLAVPFAEKNEAKRLGAKWDNEHKCWYAKDSESLSSLQKWLPHQQNVATGSIEDFCQAAQSIGLDMSRFNNDSGKWHRTPLEGKGNANKDGAYKLFNNPDGTIGGIARNLSTGEDITWSNRSAEYEKVAPEVTLANELNRIIHTEIMQNAHQQIAIQRSKDATTLFKSLQNATGQEPYLVNKGMQFSHGIKRLDDGSIVVPLINGERIGGLASDNVGITSLQVIKPDGSKRLMKQGNKVGSYFPIGTSKARRNPSHVIVTEGIATAESVSQIMCSIHGDRTLVVAAIDSGNLAHVVEKMQVMYPEVSKTIAADNDIATEKKTGINPGMKAAQDILDKYPNINIIAPTPFAEKNTDWNDALLRDGLENSIKNITHSNTLTKDDVKININGKCAREIGLEAYVAIDGNLKRLPEVKAVLKSAGYTFDDKRLEGVANHPLAMKEAFGQAINKLPEKNNHKSQSQER